MTAVPTRALLPGEVARLLRLFLLANAIGAGVGVGIWLYGREIELITALRLQLAAGLPRALVLPLVGLLGGAAAGGLIAFEPAARGSGIVHVLLWLRGRAVALGWRVAVVKLLASGLAIGSGIPVGPEGPSIQIGASVARVSADALHSGRHRRLAVAVGSGAGLAAVFHAPLGGIAYILEEMLGRSSLRSNAVAAFTTFMALVWTRLLNEPGDGPLLLRNLIPIEEVPSRVNELRLIELPLLLGLGVAAALLAFPYQRGLLALKRRFDGLALPAWKLLPLLGLAMGALGVLLPRAFDNADRLSFAALAGMNSPAEALRVLLIQGLGTAVAVAADAPGGFLAPALVVGASLGTLAQQLAGITLHLKPATLLFAGGSAFLGALTRTPLTAILLTFELSKDYALLLPIGLCTLAAIAVADLLARRTVVDAMLEEAMEKTTPLRKPDA
ncbi:chloride channel protein [Cyanobium sp. FGCU-6]|nr:chloride channel protein [Cyanobium sp. FGCU6]